MSTIEAINSIITSKLNTMISASKILDSISILGVKQVKTAPAQSQKLGLSDVGVDIDFEDDSCSLTNSAKDLLTLYMRHTTAIQVQYASLSRRTSDKDKHDSGEDGSDSDDESKGESGNGDGNGDGDGDGDGDSSCGKPDDKPDDDDDVSSSKDDRSSIYGESSKPSKPGARDKEFMDQYNQALLSNSIVVKLEQLESSIRSTYNILVKRIMQDSALQPIYSKSITKAFTLLEQLEKSVKLSQKKLRSVRKDSQIKECPECKSKMTLHVDFGKYQCGKCKLRKTAYGIVPCDVYLDHTATTKSSGNYRQEDNCEIWLNKLQGLESKKIPKTVLKKLKRKAEEEHAMHHNGITCIRIRHWLKDVDVDETTYNNHTPKIKFLMTGLAPERLTDAETQETKLYFKPVMDEYNKVKSPDRKNSLYQPFVILKILEQVVDRSTVERERRFLRIVSNIHFQDRETIRRNDEIMSRIHVGLNFTPTDVEYYIANI